MERAALLGRRLSTTPAGLDLSWSQVIGHDGPSLVFVLFAIAAGAAFLIPPLVIPAAIVLVVLAFGLWARAGRIRRLARDGVAVPGLVEWTSGQGEEAVFSTALGGFRRRAIVSYDYDGTSRKIEVRVLNPQLASIVVVGETLAVVVDPARPADANLPLLYLG
jgi:hypothetical protein